MLPRAVHGIIFGSDGHMLTHLFIKNYALIDTLDIDFGSGFSVITGETGAGKSIILGALLLLLGERADSKAIGGSGERCVVEGHFNLSPYNMEELFTEADIDYDATDTIIRREVTAAGKSRAFVNDSPAQLAFLKTLGARLIDIHSQHRNLIVGKETFQLSVVDTIAHDEALLSTYKQAFAQYRTAERALSTLEESLTQARAEAEMLTFRRDEISALALTAGEQEALEQRAEAMDHAEELKSALYTASTLLSDEEHGATIALLRSSREMGGIARMLPAAGALSERIVTASIEVKDIAEEVGALLRSIDFDPVELEAVHSRLDKIYATEKKYHVDSCEALIAMCDEASAKLAAVDDSDETVAECRRHVTETRERCVTSANVLSEARAKAAKVLEGEMVKRLAALGMPSVTFSVTISPAELSEHGADRVAFLFSANKSMPVRALADVASGGEMARVMLTLKALLSSAVHLPTIIFDEIDTGVSGAIAGQMAVVMRELAQAGTQVINITHLPQIAAMGCRHYRVYKDDKGGTTTTHMDELSSEERVNEVAAMLSGSEVTAAAIRNAKELLGM